MRWFISGLSILVVALLLLVVFLPAALLPRALQELDTRRMLPADMPKLVLTDTRGTVWRGQSDAATAVIDGVELDLGVLRWNIDGLSVLQGQPLIQLSADSEQLQAVATVEVAPSGQTTLSAVEGRLPVTTLEPWMPMLVTGDIGFFIDRLVFLPNRLLAIKGLLNFEYIDWVGADHNMPLGSYMAELSQLDDQQLSIVISDLEARLGIAGTLIISPSGRYRFDAILQPRPGLAPEVNQSIRWFGRVDSAGNVVVNTSGQL